MPGSYERLFHDTEFERFVLPTATSRDVLVIHIDTTSALTPLERWSRENSDLPETYPTGV
jgi:hypothetical protein